MRAAVSAGEALPPALFERFRERFGVEILDGIGSTEILHILIPNPPGAMCPASSGRTVPGFAPTGVDERRRRVATGGTGHRPVRGESAGAFYRN